MQLQITGQHVEITDALQELIEKKMAKLTRHADRIGHVHVVLSVEKHEHTVKVNLHLPGAEINAHASTDDMYKSVDACVDKLIRQLDKK